MRTVFSLELRKIFSYRADFWIHFVGGLLTQITLAYFLWQAIFQYNGVDEMRGYSFFALMLYYVMVPLVDRMVRGPEASQVATEIYEGTLNRYLIYPVSFFYYKYVTHIAQTTIFTLQFFVALAVFIGLFGMPEGTSLKLEPFLMGMGLVLIGSVFYFSLVAMLEMFAFWADHVWSLIVMLRFIMFFTGGGMIPLEFFPDSIVAIINLLPFPYLTAYPIQGFLGRLTFEFFIDGMLVMSIWTILAVVGVQFVWRNGLRRYSGIGM